MKRKNILFMAQIPPPVHGAALRNKSVLDSKLINTNFKLIPLPLKFVDDMKDLEKISFKKIFLMLTYALRLFFILASRKVDLAYFTMTPSGSAFYRDVVFITILKIFRKKRVLHFRRKGIKKTAQSSFGKALVKYAFKGSNIICLSDHQILDLDGHNYNIPYKVPNGIKIENNYDSIRKLILDRDEKPVKILFLSNLSVRKGVVELVNALSILKQRGYQFETGIVGSEWDMSNTDVMNLLVTNELEEMVSLKGPRYGEDKLKSFAEADIFVFPTYFELFPGVILEAMQFGKAIVSTFEGSIPEIIDNNINGILVKQQDSEALAKGISFFIDQPDMRTKMGSLAREKFYSKFTLPVFEENMAKVFKDVIEK